jgi:deoxyguanosine kinase
MVGFVMSRIEICGGIAAGKTTLLKLLRIPGLDPLFEDFSANPFWKVFFADPKLFGFETEMTFALLHLHQVKRSQNAGGIICDFSFLLDRAFAKICLTGIECSLVEAVHKQIADSLGPPALLIDLRCAPEVELARITQRGRPEEVSVSLDYLQELNDNIEGEVNRLRGHMPIVSIDSGSENFLLDSAVLHRIRTEVMSKL